MALPESPRFLAQRPQRWPALEQLLRRMGHAVPAGSTLRGSRGSAARPAARPSANCSAPAALARYGGLVDRFLLLPGRHLPGLRLAAHHADLARNGCGHRQSRSGALQFRRRAGRLHLGGADDAPWFAPSAAFRRARGGRYRARHPAGACPVAGRSRTDAGRAGTQRTAGERSADLNVFAGGACVSHHGARLRCRLCGRHRAGWEAFSVRSSAPRSSAREPALTGAHSPCR